MTLSIEPSLWARDPVSLAIPAHPPCASSLKITHQVIVSASGADLPYCSHCIKTKKRCTMKYAWSQTQITIALAAAAREDSHLDGMIPQKRQRTREDLDCFSTMTNPDITCLGSLPELHEDAQNQYMFTGAESLGLDMPTFSDNPLDTLPLDFLPLESDIPGADFDTTTLDDMTASSEYPSEQLSLDLSACSETFDSQAPPEFQFNDCASGFHQPIATHRSVSFSSSSYADSESQWARPKRRCKTRDTTKQRTNSTSLSPFSVDHSLMERSNNQFISTNLLQIYHDVLEHNLSCWLTEVTCPYRAGYNTSSSDTIAEWGSSWSNRIYRRTVRLDQVAQSTTHTQLNRAEEKAATKALHLSIMAFATQWAQGSRRQREQYPTHTDNFEEDRPEDIFDNVAQEFDRNIQRNLWEQAQRALQDVADVESYRVACAELIFGLTQKPWVDDDDAKPMASGLNHWRNQGVKFDPDSMTAEIGGMIARDGVPVFIERAARKMHALKFRFDSARRGVGKSNSGAKGKDAMSVMGVEDRGTIGLLYWLAVMFETVSSSMNERPLVVADADSQHDDAREEFGAAEDGRWNIPLFIQDSLEKPCRTVHWPCSYEAAAESVTRSAPVKVLLYRLVSNLQNILRRGGRGQKVEDIIRNTASVYRYWNMTHGAFFRELLRDYESVPGRIQSWFVCISAHWHLAALMLADLIEFADDNELGVPAISCSRLCGKMVTRIREASARELSDLARVSTPTNQDATGMTAPQLSHFHHAVNEATILTEPWTIILIRAFSKAAVLLMSEASDALEYERATSRKSSRDFQEPLRRAEACVKGLWLLGKKSDMARKVAETLSLAMIRLRR
ncbi:hypothetical protein FZEAL_5440 [Fusarium zealandicum]|uniref:Regulatory protein alcR n=1 Tax=Fusarium zealandicum TaxID=1053134 RepID=A0A8H4XJT2_9HYPO|nr:hypothetical protein FZEAL_5440 [Fusarium zealandicum]